MDPALSFPMLRTMLLLLAGACNSSDDTSPDGPPGKHPGIVLFALSTPNENAPLVRRIVVETDALSTLAVDLVAPDHQVSVSFPGEATHHEHTLLGLKAGREYQVTATASFDGAESATRTQATTTAGPWPQMPVPEVVTDDPARRAPGDTMLPLRCADSQCGEPNETVLVVDEAGEIVYLLSVDDIFNDTMQDAIEYDGGILALVGTSETSAIHYAWDGTELARWRVNPLSSDTIDVQSAYAHSLHHDIVPHPLIPDSFLAIGRYRLTVLQYPGSYDVPELVGESFVADDVALEFRTDGSVTREIKLSDYIPTSRIGYNSLDVVIEGWRDWAHANAIVLDPADGDWILSLRHQDAVVKINQDVSGDLVWIAGNPDNWPVEYADRLLTPVGSPFKWQYHQHAPLIIDEGDGTKTMILFDNGNAQTSPYSGEVPLVLPDHGDALPAALMSRVVAYTIDEQAMTISQQWEFDRIADGTLFAEAVGDVDVLENGNVLSAWGYLQTLPGGKTWYTQAGFGDKAVRVIEIDPVTLDEVWHIHLTVDGVVNPAGVTAYRAERIPALAGRVVD